MRNILAMLRPRVLFLFSTSFLFSLVILTMGFQSEAALQEVTPKVNENRQRDSMAIRQALIKAESFTFPPGAEDSAQIYIDQATALNEQTLNSRYFEAYVHYVTGVLNFHMKNDDQSLVNFAEALQIMEEIEEHRFAVSTCYRLITVYYRRLATSLEEIAVYAEKGLEHFAKLSPQSKERASFFGRQFPNELRRARAYRGLDEEKIEQLINRHREARKALQRGIDFHNQTARYDSAYITFIHVKDTLEDLLEEVDDVFMWQNYLSCREWIIKEMTIQTMVGDGKTDQGRKLQEIQEVIELADDHLNVDDPKRINILCELAAELQSLDPDRSKAVFFETMAIDQNNWNCQQYLADLYLSLQDHEKAIELKKALFQAYSFRGPYYKGLTSQDLARAYCAAGQYEKAEKYAALSLQLLPAGRIAPNHPRYAMASHILAQAYVAQDKFSAALPLLENAAAIFIGVGGQEVFDLIEIYQTHAMALMGLGRLAEAQRYLELASESLITSSFIYHKFDLAYQFGKLFLLQGDYAAALRQTEAACRILDPDNQGPRTIAYKKRYLSALQLKGDVFFRQYEDRQSLPHLERAIAHYQEAIEMVDIIRESYNWRASKRELLREADDLFKMGMRAVAMLYKVDPSEEVARIAFNFSEKRKSIVLLEAVQREETKLYARIPDQLLEREKEVQLMLNFHQQSLFTERQKEEPNSVLEDLYDRNVRKLTNSLDSLALVLKKKHPEYFALNYGIDIVSTEEIQKKLKNEKAAMVEYVVQEDRLFVFVLKEDGFRFFEIPLMDDLSLQVQQLQKSAITFHLGQSRSEEVKLAYADTLTQAAHFLYRQLLEPVFSQIELPEKLIIVPDGVLGYLPFELLLRELPERSDQFGAHAYLILDHQISYTYSATLLRELENKRFRSTKKGLLAFAPSFVEVEASEEGGTRSIPELRSELTPLHNNIPEVENIGALFDGTIYTGEEATEERFLAEAPLYSILHLSTHGKANDEAGDLAYLAFAPVEDSLGYELFYNRDLYNLKLNADLVVLSACETGIGELQKGEGIISLARGFSFAGSKSIVTTLWSVDDTRSRELMEGFYTYLKDGLTKDAALRQAKLDFIDKYKHDAHPFFWAPFIPIGDMASLQFDSARNWIWMGLVFLSFVVALFFYFRG